MIVVKLSGGLGNQMFQYACGLSLAHDLDTELYLDLSSYNNHKHLGTVRHFELDIFKIIINLATEKELKKFYPPSNALHRQFWKLARKANPTLIIEEKDFSYRPIEHQRCKNLHLIGYWQSYRYFNPVAEKVRKSFSFTSSPNAINAKTLEEIQACESVAVHIRRGDYVSDKSTNQFHGVCSLPYYTEAIKYMRAHLKEPFFFFFSDDPDWVKHTFEDVKNSKVIDYNKDVEAYNDMRLMAACRHNIIANSSFSWWGAWLSNHQNKIIIAPEQWFAKKDNSYSTNDLLPDHWLKF